MIVLTAVVGGLTGPPLGKSWGNSRRQMFGGDENGEWSCTWSARKRRASIMLCSLLLLEIICYLNGENVPRLRMVDQEEVSSQ